MPKSPCEAIPLFHQCAVTEGWHLTRLRVRPTGQRDLHSRTRHRTPARNAPHAPQMPLDVPLERKIASVPPVLAENSTRSGYFTAFHAPVTVTRALLVTKLAKEETLQALEGAPRTDDGKQRLCWDNSCHRGCIFPAGKCAHSHKLIIAVEDFHWALQAEFLRRGGLINGIRTEAADADRLISQLRDQARRDVAGQGALANAAFLPERMDHNRAIIGLHYSLWTIVPRHYREGDLVCEGKTPIDPHLDSAPSDFFESYQPPGVDYGDLLTYDDDETIASFLGLEQGTPERRQCLLLATAAATLWAQHPDKTPTTTEVHGLAGTMRRELFQAAKNALSTLNASAAQLDLKDIHMIFRFSRRGPQQLI